MKISIPVPSHAQLHGGGFEAGILHPVLGFDHLLAMVAVGIIATKIGGKSVYTVPLIFVSVMFLGALFGFNHVSFTYDEIGIAFSVIILGMMIIFSKELPTYAIMLCVAFFAFFHGHAHGVELPNVSSKLSYSVGFVLATVGLHISGIVLTWLIFKSHKETILFFTISLYMICYGSYLFLGYL